MENNSESPNPSNKLKKDWYQTDSHVIITIFIKGVNEDNLQINFEERGVNVAIKLPSSLEVIASFDLWHYIRPNESSYKVFSTKVEIKLKKKEALRWETLEGEAPDREVKQITVSESALPAQQLSQYPSSAVKKHDWDKLEAEVKRAEETEKPEGDAALNQLFQKIYADGNEEVKRAMNKSFMESGGTVLSTNWKEVGLKQVDVKAPDGMEWKKWEK